MFGDLKYKHRHDGKAVTEGKTGTEVFKRDGTLQQRAYRVDRIAKTYDKVIDNPTQGVHIEKHEKLPDHRR